MPDIRFRLAERQDLTALRALYAASVEAAAPGDYSPQQIAAWAGYASEPAFAAFVLDPMTLIAIRDQQRIGFCGIELSGHITSLYVHPDHLRCGIGTALLGEALKRCPRPLAGHWFAEASLFSRPVFARLGFEQVGLEQTERGDVGFERYLMRCIPESNQRIV
ncbi:GNAT family N-acetyltransferase [Halochromatium sp.]